MTSASDAAEFLVALISQLFHADVLITEQAERIDSGRLHQHIRHRLSNSHRSSSLHSGTPQRGSVPNDGSGPIARGRPVAYAQHTP
jgi:hypothetical protein